MKSETKSENVLLPFSSRTATYFNRRFARKLVNKHVIVGLTYLQKSGKVSKQIQYHGTVLSEDLTKGVEIWEDGTSKIKSLPPDLRAWSLAGGGTYTLRSTGEIVNNVDYVSSWLVKTKKEKFQPLFSDEMLRHKQGYYNLYGFGTQMYGRAIKLSDGSYSTTKWFTLLYFPIWPIASFRITSNKPVVSFGFGIDRYHSSEPLFLDLRQVFNTYVLWLLLVVLFVFLFVK